MLQQAGPLRPCAQPVVGPQPLLAPWPRYRGEARARWRRLCTQLCVGLGVCFALSRSRGGAVALALAVGLGRVALALAPESPPRTWARRPLLARSRRSGSRTGVALIYIVKLRIV